MKQKKIIIFMPSIEGGGVEKNLYLITNFLCSKLDEIKLITTSNNTEKINKKIKIINNKFLSSISINRLLKIIFSSIFLIFELMKSKNFVVFSFQANLFAILISKFFRKKIIIRLNSSPSGWLNNFIKKKIFQKIYSLADVVIVNSQQFKKELWSEIKVKSFCIYNPLDKKNILKKAKKIIKNNPFKKRKSLKIINIGRLVDQKDQLTLLKSINYLKNDIRIEAIIIGQGRNEIILKDYIREKNLEKIIKILNFQKNPYPYIKLSDVFILTSLYEGLPNVLLEAITLKKSVISSDCKTGPKEILNYGKAGTLFKTGSYKDLSKKIIRFTKNKKENTKMRKIAFKSLKKYDYNKNLREYLKKIQEIN